jgi:hypothetical protein
MPHEATLEQCQVALDALRVVLADEDAFEQVLDRFFKDLDTNDNHVLDTVEFEDYIRRCCETMDGN